MEAVTHLGHCRDSVWTMAAGILKVASPPSPTTPPPLAIHSLNLQCPLAPRGRPGRLALGQSHCSEEVEPDVL